MKSLILIIPILYAALGCSASEKMNEASLKAGINDYLEYKGLGCIQVGNKIDWKHQFPYVVKPSVFSDVAKLDKLVDAGFLSSRIKDDCRYKESKIYDLTDKGRRYFDDYKHGFCYGKVSVKEIISYTEPQFHANAYTAYTPYSARSLYTGHKTSKVKYVVQVDDLASWTKSKQVQDAFPSIEMFVENKEFVEGADLFVSTNKGWVHNDIFLR